MLAGSQSGKTSLGPFWLYREIQAKGPGDYLAVTSSYDLLKLRMLPALRETFETLFGIGQYSAGDKVLTLSQPPDTRIILRSAVSDSGLEAATAKAAWLDECGQPEFTLETWEAVLRRLAIAQGRVLGTTTPYLQNWLKHEWYDRWVAGEPDYAVVNFASTMNPVYPRAEYERAKATMPAWRFAMFVQGLFDRPAGLVYDCFDPDRHVVDDFPLPPTWPRYVGIDFGGVNHALVWVALQPTTRACYVYREELTPDLTTPERAAQARAHLDREHVAGWYGGAPSEDQQRRDWRAAGVDVRRPAVADLEAGIDRVTALIKAERLLVFRSLTGLRDEFGAYRRKLDDGGQTTPEIVNKRTFHRLDALRYVAPALAGPEPVPGVTTLGQRPQFAGSGRRQYGGR